MNVEVRLREEVARHPYPLIFATISGAHLYGFPSPDSDYDLRGCHVLPVQEVVGLDVGRETIESSKDDHGLELDLVTHDAKKFFGLLLRKNGYVLEQLYSPLVVHTTPEHEELKAIARGCVTRHHSHHYFGFAETQWRLFEKERPRRVKPLLKDELEAAHKASTLPEGPTARPALNDLLVRIRMGSHSFVP